MTIKKPEPVAWIRHADITEIVDTEPETDGWVPLVATSDAEAYAQARVDVALGEVESFVVRTSALEMLTGDSAVNNLLNKIRALKGKV